MQKFLITGANGFLGNYFRKAYSWESLKTLGLTNCDINVDLSEEIPIFNECFYKVIHAAGLAHVKPSDKVTEKRFFDVNVKGTANLLSGLEHLQRLPELIVFISTVSVYGVDQGEEIDESAPLKGTSPYALSKIDAENIIWEWGVRNNVKTLILRLPLIAGANPPGNLGSMIRAIKNGYYFRIGDGNARKSMVLAEDVAEFVANIKPCSGIYNLTDGYHPSLCELDQAIAAKLNKKIRKIPVCYIKPVARLGDIIPLIPINSEKFEKLTCTLTFSDTRARMEIGWHSKPVIENFQL